MVEETRMRQSEGYDLDDYAEIDFTDVEQSYTVGTNANTADPTVPLFEAHRAVFLPTEDCWIRFNCKDRVRHRLFANDYREFKRRIDIIYVTRVAINGTLHCWFEG